ncbi:RNA-binding protein [Paenalkalicoccus suaedae]|uniref:RNA-binding protein n=1 Tax=Paenalkalicoccus suaedae TaxID=2592382 RepID=A0A859FFC1_9BACI|nr:YlmH/Sll1252 family protein [Paenalkalicoccus suaedae]QKS71508.1 RNA-binding protein [Paenalkalicoccus suaedae]
MSVYQHYRKEEHAFVDQVLDWKEIVEREYRAKLTDFLDPRKQRILLSLIGAKSEVLVSFHGAYEGAERKRALLHPDYLDPSIEDFELACYDIRYPEKYTSIEHPQVLGSLMGLGMKREKFGDIIIASERAQIIVAKEVSGFVEQEFTHVGKHGITLDSLQPGSLVTPDEEMREQSGTISSLRLDAVLAEVFKLSRAKVKPLIQSEKVKVNWQIIEDPAYLLKEGDVLSLRGSGRCQIIELGGETKKGKQRIIVGIIGA